MKKAYILFNTFLISAAFVFLMVFMISYTDYIPRYASDFYRYTQANILLDDSKELAKYFYYKNNGIKNVNFDYLNYNINIDYFYPQNNKSIIINSSVYFKSENVNEEIYLNKIFILYLK